METRPRWAVSAGLFVDGSTVLDAKIPTQYVRVCLDLAYRPLMHDVSVIDNVSSVCESQCGDQPPWIRSSDPVTVAAIAEPS